MTTTRWKLVSRPHLGLANRISALITRKAWSDPDSLPDFRATSKVLVACDYSGDAKHYRFRSLSVLIADACELELWDRLRTRLRRECFREPRRIAFKSIRERQRAAALVPFLRAANTLPGILFTLLVDKHIPTVFRCDHELDESGRLLVDRLQGFDPVTRERLFLLAHCLGLLFNGLTHPRQDVLIISDEDSVFANDSRHRLVCSVLERIISNYLSHTLGRVQVCTTKSDTGRLDLEDLTSIPDLAGGALTECAGVRDGRGGLIPGVLRPIDRSQSRKMQAVVGWYAESWHPLKRIAVLLENAAEDRIVARMVNVLSERPIPAYDWRRDDTQ